MDETRLTLDHEDRFVLSSAAKTGDLFDPAGINGDEGRDQDLT